MNRVVLSAFVVGLMTACGPSMEADHVKTPDELIADEIAKGDEQLKNQKNSSDYDDTSAGPTDEDKRRGWDAKQSDIELHRASHSAESCPQSIEEKDPKAKGKAKPAALAKATLAITFANDGHVKDATIAPYEADSPLGKCVLRAMKAIIVPSYEGSEQVVNWEIDLSGGKKSGPVGGEAASEEKK